MFERWANQLQAVLSGLLGVAFFLVAFHPTIGHVRAVVYLLLTSSVPLLVLFGIRLVRAIRQERAKRTSSQP
jgi:uncharacterized membrane protein